MFFSYLFQSPASALFFLATVVVAVTVHEAAHAWTSNRLGDPTARLLGRISLNPQRHLDPLGSILFLFAGFGWGKPVPVDSYNLRDPEKDNAIVALAGPASNILMAAIFGTILRLTAGSLPIFLIEGIFIFGMINVLLAVFNLLPIPPLDGSRIYRAILPSSLSPFWDMLDRYGIIILFILFLAPGNPISNIIQPFISTIMRLLGY
jgi:Zn-dependent protease